MRIDCKFHEINSNNKILFLERHLKSGTHYRLNEEMRRVSRIAGEIRSSRYISTQFFYVYSRDTNRLCEMFYDFSLPGQRP